MDSENEYESLIGDLVGAFKGMSGFKSGIADSSAAALATGWVIRMCRTAEAVVVMHRHGFGVEAAPLVRSLMEHSMTTAWLVEHGDDAVAAVEFDHAESQRKLLLSASEGDLWDLDTVAAEMGVIEAGHDLDQPSEWPNFSNFQNLLTNIGRREWYVPFRLESAQTHANGTTSESYMDQERGGFSYEPVTEPTSLSMTAMFLALAMRELTKLVTNTDVLDQVLDGFEERLSIRDSDG